MGHPLRVLHAVVNMNRGGAETLIMNLYRNINRSMVQFDFLTCKEGAFDSEIIAMGGRIHRIPYVTEVGHVRYVKELDQFFKKNHGYKIIHSHMDKMSGLVLRAAKKANVPVRIAHSHNTQSEGGTASKIYKWYAGKQIRPNATHLYACSQAAGKWLFANRYGEANLLKNGIECDQFQFSAAIRSEVRKELHLDRDALAIGHIGRFNHQKNHLFLLEVFADLIKVRPDTVLLLVGGGALQPQIEKRIKDLKLNGHVKLLGVREDVHRILQAMDLFVFPSLHEGLPVTLIEAQGAGLPCIVSDTITEEADMEMGLVQFLPLTESGWWVESIVKTAEIHWPRHVSESALTRNGYNIRKTAEFTQDAYITLGEVIV